MTNKLPVVGKRYKPKYKATFDWAEFYKFSLINGGKQIFCDLKQFLNKGESNGYVSCPLSDFWDGFEELPEDKVEIEPKNSQTVKERLDQCISDCSASSVIIRELQGEIQYLSRKLQNHISELSPEAKEAMEKLNIEIVQNQESSIRSWREQCIFVTDTARNLLKALNKQFNKESLAHQDKQENTNSGLSEQARENSDEKVTQEDWDNYHANNKYKSEYRDSKSKIIAREESIWKPVSELPEESCQVVLRFNQPSKQDRIYRYRKGEFFAIGDDRPIDESFVEKYFVLTDFINDYEKLKERVKKLEII